MPPNSWRIFSGNKVTPFAKTIPVLVIVLVFGAWAIWWGAGSVFEGYVSSSWPQTTGTIQESRAGRTRVVIYAYTVDGHSYQGNKISTRGAWNSGTSQKVVDAYPVGSQRPVYYSPTVPGNSILITGVHRSSFFGIILGTIILSFGALTGIVAYLAPTYGTWDGRSYNFAGNSPVTPIILSGIVAIMCQFGLLFWILQ
jgi:hypothetical protein